MPETPFDDFDYCLAWLLGLEYNQGRKEGFFFGGSGRQGGWGVKSRHTGTPTCSIPWWIKRIAAWLAYFDIFTHE